MSLLDWFKTVDVDQLKHSRDLDGLVGALRHRKESTRKVAGEALIDLGCELNRAEATVLCDCLIGFLNDEHRDVQNIAARVLGVLGERKAVKPLIDWREHGTSLYRENDAVDSLVLLDYPRAIPTLLKVVRENEEYLDSPRDRAIEGLKKMRQSAEQRGALKVVEKIDKGLRKVIQERPEECAVCERVLRYGQGYLFYSDNLRSTTVLEVPIGSVLLCKSCTDFTVSQAAWTKAAAGKPKFTHRDLNPESMGGLASLLDDQMFTADGVARLTLQSGLTPQEAKNKAREFSALFWEDREQGEEESRRFWTGES